MTFILDTHVVSELRKTLPGMADAKLLAWIRSVDASEPYVSAITLMELEIGTLPIDAIAATALVHGMTVVTRNVGDFRPTGVAILNPWDAT